LLSCFLKMLRARFNRPWDGIPRELPGVNPMT